MDAAVLFVLIVFTWIGYLKADIIVQSTSYCSICTYNEEFCRNPAYVNTRYQFYNRDFEDVNSNVGTSYQDGRNCIVSIEAHPNNQIEVQIDYLAIDSYAEMDDRGYPKFCYDYLKLYNGPTPDNAKMFPNIPPAGICGKKNSPADMADLQIFKTTQNHLTVQFVTDGRKESFGGFKLRISQYPYSNAGNLYPSGGNLGGWNDGSYNEFQVYWDQKDVIPGGVFPGIGGNDYSEEAGGIECYDCNFCPLEPFDPVQLSISTRSGCHVCSKEFDNSYQNARRQCYSQTDYTYLLESLSDGIDKVESYSGCKQFVTQYGRTVNYCFCQEDKCNSSTTLLYNWTFLLLCVIATAVWPSLL
ncbi:uncharacterized protein LOC110465388 [Mizuhopecten yessoensis]|uniref:CUB domain-containing protein n=1 Tax=Mizuhopecten yessoensis TaxID=6573 RepID=A0A210PRU4_MIZYE|nr:uncharacterized protein LOC110465388 [Mizuhopecten yessoensis]OWF39172.1 hypothetical protein KP79_PYT07175 [Mizuhopecten yessoensis]